MATMRPKGTNDFLPEVTKKWHDIENVLHKVCEEYGFKEIRTPLFEHTELFLRGVGDTTDIVNKEMYTFEDKGGRNLTLRPEATASTVRAFIEHKMEALPQPVKLYYMGPMFRYERPQKGRFRQFHQFGVEAFGTNDPSMDAEVIGLAMDFYSRIGLNGLEVRLNSVGCPKCRQEHKEKLQAHLETILPSLCHDCQGRYEKNPLRLFDCKNENCQRLLEGAPTINDMLCDDCKEHFQKVRQYLDEAEIPYYVDPKLVRGLDYYTHTAFEILVTEIGAKSAICGGGRYNGLVSSLGGHETPGVGFALGMERIFSALEAQGMSFPEEEDADLYLVALDEDARHALFPLLLQWRKMGIRAEMDHMGRSLKAQMKAANRLGVRYALLCGEEERKSGRLLLRDMADSSQKEIEIEAVVATVGALFKK